jgi:hypothetical protein
MTEDNERCGVQLGKPEDKDRLKELVTNMALKQPKELKKILDAMLVLVKYDLMQVTPEQKAQIQQVRDYL